MTEISGDTDRYVKAGSNVTITCTVSNALDAPRFIIWYQDATKILPENYRGAITEEKKFNGTAPISVSCYNIIQWKFKFTGNFLDFQINDSIDEEKRFWKLYLQSNKHGSCHYFVTCDKQ